MSLSLFFFLLPKQRSCETHKKPVNKHVAFFSLTINKKNRLFGVIIVFSDMVDRHRIVPHLKEQLTGKFFVENIYSFIYYPSCSIFRGCQNIDSS